MIEIDETIAGHLKRYEAIFQERDGSSTVIFECPAPQDDSEWTAFRLFLAGIEKQNRHMPIIRFTTEPGRA